MTSPPGEPWALSSTRDLPASRSTGLGAAGWTGVVLESSGLESWALEALGPLELLQVELAGSREGPQVVWFWTESAAAVPLATLISPAVALVSLA